MTIGVFVNGEAFFLAGHGARSGNRFCQTLLVLCVLVGSFCSLLGQSTTGTILGTVKDASGGVVAGANVTVHNTETQLTRTLPTGDDGAYRFSGLPTGRYDVTAERAGFKRLEASIDPPDVPPAPTTV